MVRLNTSLYWWDKSDPHSEWGLDEDDRKVRAEFMFSDMELIGIPHCIVMGDRGLDSGTVEYKARTGDANEEISFAEVIGFLKAKLA